VARDAKLKCGHESGCKAQMWLCGKVYKLLGDSIWPPKRVVKLKCDFVEMCISYGRLKCDPPAMYGSNVAANRNAKLECGFDAMFINYWVTQCGHRNGLQSSNVASLRCV
jgi:hypothetical protein